MDKIRKVLEDQLCKEIKSAEEKLTTSNLDAMYKIFMVLHCMEGKHEDIAQMAEVAEDIINKYSNGRYDHNVDALYDSYIAAKKAYQENGDQGHKDKLMEAVGRLMAEIYDLLSSMLLDSDFQDERKAINQRIRMLADM